MSEYTSTRAGFQRSMEWSLTGSPGDAHLYSEATVLPTFYHVMNGQRLDHDTYTKGLAEWRAKISGCRPVVHEFLRDGDQLAARMTGTLKLDGAETQFESFMFGKVDEESGRLAWLVERAVWGAVGREPDNGIN